VPHLDARLKAAADRPIGLDESVRCLLELGVIAGASVVALQLMIPAP
jgi:hypothetical protein